MESSLARELATRTVALCEIKSPIGEEREIADFVESWARRLVPSVSVIRESHSLVIGDVNAPIALVGHLDTVPAHPASGPVRIEGDRLYGLGSSDMKGGLAVMMLLAEELWPRQKPPTFLLVLYEREEGPYLESGLGPLFQRVPDLKKLQFGIAMEPTDNVIQVGCVGSIHAHVLFRGVSAHSARPWQGENAIHKAGAFLSRLAARQRREVTFDGYTYFEVMSATTAQGGRARNVVPDQFDVNLNYRFSPGKSLAAAQQDVLEFVEGEAEVTFRDLAPSGRVCTRNAFFQHLVKTTGLPTAAKQAWTDVARFAEMGVDAVNFGPGETAQAHQQNESASVSALVVAYEKLRTFLSVPPG